MTNSPNDSITWPAAPVPVWPCISTTRVEATFSASRNSVAISSTDGKIAKSSGLRTVNTATVIISDSAMLKVNSRSSAKAGSGSTTMASSASTATGMPRPLSSISRKVGGTAVALAGAFMAYASRPVTACSTAGSTAGGGGGGWPWRRATLSCQT